MHLTWIAHQHRVFRVTGVAAIRDFESYRETFVRTASSFRGLRSDEREVRLRAYPVRSGEGLAAFINRTGGVWKVERAAVANGIADDATPEAGVLVKVPIPQRYTDPEPAK
jgi:hypothetical protein